VSAVAVSRAGNHPFDGAKKMDLKFLEPQSRWMVNTFFKRDFDTFVDSAKTRINRMVLVADVVMVYILIQLI